MLIPPEFENYHHSLLGEDYAGFIRYFLKPQERSSIRVNTLKSTVREVKRILSERGLEYGSVAWCPEGLWVGSQELDYMEHELGLYYIQNASSMVVPQVLGAGDCVLDMCAAPGGKTTHLAQLMGNKGLLVANEDNHNRIKGLVYNIQRCGVSNAVVTKLDGCRFSQYGERFDRILVDAPCSSVGTLRQSREVLQKWNLEWVGKLAQVQKKMVLAAFDSLMDRGVMVYSTCTTTLEENEQVVEYLLAQRADARLVKVELPGLKMRRGLTERARDCGRVYPQDNDSDPYYIAKVMKGG